MINVLFVNFASENFDGATLSLIDLINSIKNEVHPIVLLRSKGKVYDYFKNNDIECIVHTFIENAVASPKKIHQFVKYGINLFPTIYKYQKINKKCLKEVCNVLEGRNIAVVHTNNTVLDIGYYIAKLLNAKHVWHLRGFMDLGLGWMPLMGWKNYHRLLQKSDAVIGITNSVLYHYISKESLNAYKIFDAVRGFNDTSLVVPKQKYFLFCAGLLTEQKGYGIAVEAFAQSGLFHEGYRLRIIGEKLPQYYKKVQKIIEKYKISEYIDHLGRINDVRQHFEHATAFLMCSQNEGLGRVTVESMFYGCPVLGRLSGGTSEIVTNGITGYCFNSTSECALLMKKIAKEDTSIIIKQAQDFARQNFSIENYGAKIMHVYKTILTKK